MTTTGGSRRSTSATGVRARLLGLVLVPTLGLGALAATHVVDLRHDAEQADVFARAVARSTQAFEAFAAIQQETLVAATLTQAASFGLDPQQVGELLGLDLASALADARADVDASMLLADLQRDLGGRAALVHTRAALDGGDSELLPVLTRLSARVQEAWTDEMAGLAALAADRDVDASGSLHQALGAFADSSTLYLHAYHQLRTAAAAVVPGVRPVGDGVDVATASARVDAAMSSLLVSADGPTRDLALRIAEDRRFDERLRDLDPHDGASGDVDIDLVVAAFDEGLRRYADIEELTRLAGAAALAEATTTGSAARSAYESTVSILLGIAVASVAIAVLVARSIARPLSRLERRAAEISDGTLDGAPLPLDGPREAAVLASTLNDAVENLRAVERQATALAAGDLAAAAASETPGKLSALLQRSVDGLARSIRDRAELQARLRHEVDHDTLTGLANRRAALARLKELLEEGDAPLAVLFFDVDGLKKTNDQHGHAAGDALLLETARRLSAAAPSGSLVARVGGDEFVLATRLGDDRVATALAERIVHELGNAVVADGLLLRGGASAGVALSQPGESPDDVLRWADLALLEAKRDGRGRAVHLDEGARAAHLDAEVLDTRLRAAIVAGELELHYQPIVDVATGDVACVEALVRWRQPDGDLVPPDRFIGIAERTGSIVEVDQWVLRTAAAQVAAWRAGPLPGLRLAVNASARTLLRDGFVEDLAAVLVDTGLEAGALEVEVTETALLHDLDTAAQTIHELHAMGARASIDDFGTGYTSVSQLRRLPVDKVKIDRSFINGMSDARDRTLVDLVIRIGHVLGVDVVAEGVETEEQLQDLRSLGCELAQGYLLGRPIPAGQIVARCGHASPTYA